jgi:hypothetical protein
MRKNTMAKSLALLRKMLAERIAAYSCPADVYEDWNYPLWAVPRYRVMLEKRLEQLSQ